MTIDVASSIAVSMGARRPDARVLEDMHDWYRKCLGCMAGRREFNKGRYMIELATRESVVGQFLRFTHYASHHDKVACLFIFNEPLHYEENGGSAHDAFAFLAHQMRPLSDSPARELARGAALSNQIIAPCPVTGVPVMFDDFDCIAFCPQSSNPNDPLYDPLMHAPYTCVNLSSDVFGFAIFVRDMSLLLFGEEVYRLRDPGKIEAVFDASMERFQKMAVGTIKNFEKVTDRSKCPIHLSADQRTWVAAHQDPAFAEDRKESYVHEMPQIYAPRLIEKWRAHLSGDAKFCPMGMSNAGVRV